MDQRFYASTYGRFLTPDPSAKSAAKTGNSGSWNQYAYTRGDPVNRFDPRGTDDTDGSYFSADCASLFADASQPYDASSPCSGNPCPGVDLVIGQFADNPDAATFAAQALEMGCSDSQPTYQPPQPQCSISEYERPVFGIFDHTYLDVIDPLLGIYDILEGGPTRHPKVPNPFGGNWGKLNGLISGSYVANAPKSLRGDNPGTNDQIVSVTGGTDVCLEVLELIANVVAYDSRPQAQYLPVPHGSFRNSNSLPTRCWRA